MQFFTCCIPKSQFDNTSKFDHTNKNNSHKLPFELSCYLLYDFRIANVNIVMQMTNTTMVIFKILRLKQVQLRCLRYSSLQHPSSMFKKLRSFAKLRITRNCTNIDYCNAKVCDKVLYKISRASLNNINQSALQFPNYSSNFRYSRFLEMMSTTCM